LNEKRNEKKEGKKPVGAAILVLISHPHPNITDPCIPTIPNEFSKENKLLCVQKENEALFSSHPVNVKTQKRKILRRNLTNLKY